MKTKLFLTLVVVVVVLVGFSLCRVRGREARTLRWDTRTDRDRKPAGMAAPSRGAFCAENLVLSLDFGCHGSIE